MGLPGRTWANCFLTLFALGSGTICSAFHSSAAPGEGARGPAGPCCWAQGDPSARGTAKGTKSPLSPSLSHPCPRVLLCHLLPAQPHRLSHSLLLKVSQDGLNISKNMGLSMGGSVAAAGSGMRGVPQQAAVTTHAGTLSPALPWRCGKKRRHYDPKMS